jgi:hypothetical protein
MEALPKDVLEKIIADAKNDVDNPLRSKMQGYSSESEPLQEHTCDDTCEHNGIRLPYNLARIIDNRARRIANQKRRGSKRKRR